MASSNFVMLISILKDEERQTWLEQVFQNLDYDKPYWKTTAVVHRVASFEQA